MTVNSRRYLVKLMNKVELTDTYWTPSPEYRGYTFHFSAHGTFIKWSIHRDLNKFPEAGTTEQGRWWKYMMPGTARALCRLKGSSSARTVVNHTGMYRWIASLNADSILWAWCSHAEIYNKHRKPGTFTTTKLFPQVREEVQTKLKTMWKTTIKNTPEGSMIRK